MAVLETPKRKVEGLHLLTSRVTQQLPHIHLCRFIWHLKENYPFKFFRCIAGALATSYFQALMVQASYLSPLGSFSLRSCSGNADFSDICVPLCF